MTDGEAATGSAQQMRDKGIAKRRQQPSGFHHPITTGSAQAAATTLAYAFSKVLSEATGNIGRPPKDAQERRRIAFAVAEPAHIERYAALGWRTAFGLLMSRGEHDAHKIATAIGTNIENELRWGEVRAAMPDAVQRIARSMKANVYERRLALKEYKRLASAYANGIGWARRHRLWIGMLCLRAAVNLGWLEVPAEPDPHNAKQTRRLVRFTSLGWTSLSEKLSAWKDSGWEWGPLVNATFMKWEAPLNPLIPSDLLDRAPTPITGRLNHWDQLARIEKANPTKFYDAINALQETPFRINSEVLSVLRAAIEWGPDCSVAKPGSAVGVNQEKSAKAERARISACVTMAAEFAGAGLPFFFPYRADYRGRIYPLVVGLSPQGPSWMRALLLFATGKPLGSSEAVHALAIHGANMAGLDKQSPTERIAWIRQHDTDLCAAAKNPDSCEFWHRGDAWQFLAFCFEWARFREAEDSGHGLEFVSSLPTQSDGRCNALQHMAALVRDQSAAARVGLTHAPGATGWDETEEGCEPPSRSEASSNVPRDIYADVAELIPSALTARSRLKKSDTDHGGVNAGLWLQWAFGPHVVERVDEAALRSIWRKLVKAPVMTLGYAATHHGRAKQISDTLKELGAAGHLAPLGPKPQDWTDRGAAWVLAEACGKVLPKLAPDVVGKLMPALQGLARALAKQDLPVCWTSPSGFPVVMTADHNDADGELNFPDFKMRLRRPSPSPLGGPYPWKQDSARAANKIVANFVHSIDAAHLHITLSKLRALGVSSIATVHDEYVMLAADAGTVTKVLLGSLGEIYSGAEDFGFEIRNEAFPPAPPKTSPPLNDLFQAAQQALDEHRPGSKAKLPCIPEPGSWSPDELETAFNAFSGGG
jgi:hypothetical protein